MVHAAAVRIEHLGVAEVPLLDRPPQCDERPFRHGDPLDLGGHDLEDAGLEDHLRVGGVDLGDLMPGPFEIAEQVRLAAPEAEGPPDELRPGLLEHPDVVFEVAPAVEQALHRDRPGEVVLQDLSRDGPVEAEVARPRGRLREPGMTARDDVAGAAGRAAAVVGVLPDGEDRRAAPKVVVDVLVVADAE